jgi:hypothetical protein
VRRWRWTISVILIGLRDRFLLLTYDRLAICPNAFVIKQWLPQVLDPIENWLHRTIVWVLQRTVWTALKMIVKAVLLQRIVLQPAIHLLIWIIYLILRLPFMYWLWVHLLYVPIVRYFLMRKTVFWNRIVVPQLVLIWFLVHSLHPFLLISKYVLILLLLSLNSRSLLRATLLLKLANSLLLWLVTLRLSTL